MHWVGVRIPRGMIGTKSGKKKFILGLCIINIVKRANRAPSVMRIWTPCSWLLLLRPYVPSIDLSTLCFPV